MHKHEIERVRAWANDKLATGQEPPWAWYQYMKLRETLDAILAGQAVTTPEDSPQSGQHPEKHLRLVADNDLPENAPRRPGELPVQMPM